MDNIEVYTWLAATRHDPPYPLSASFTCWLKWEHQEPARCHMIHQRQCRTWLDPASLRASSTNCTTCSNFMAGPSDPGSTWTLWQSLGATYFEWYYTPVALSWAGIWGWRRGHVWDHACGCEVTMFATDVFYYEETFVLSVFSGSATFDTGLVTILVTGRATWEQWSRHLHSERNRLLFLGIWSHRICTHSGRLLHTRGCRMGKFPLCDAHTLRVSGDNLSTAS